MSCRRGWRDCRPRCCADSPASTAAPGRVWRPPGSPARPLYSVLTALAKMIAPCSELCDQHVIARREIDVVARVTPPVERMSCVSNGSLNEKTTPYIGICSRSGCRPYVASSSAARSSASGNLRNSSHTGCAGGSGPSDTCRSKSPLQVTERSPRMLRVASAFTCPACGMPTIIPNCCCTAGSEAVASMRPYSRGGPLYLSRSGRIVEALTVAVGKRSGACARTAPVLRGPGRRLE